jgi:hypothetical protein
LNQPKESVFRNCFSVRPVRKSSLIVNQCLKRVCFLDVTTYHSPPYDYTRTNEDPSKRLLIRAIRGKGQYNIAKRQQAKEFFHLKERPHRLPQWAKFTTRRSERNWTYHKNLQDPYILRNGRDGNNTLFSRPAPKWYFRSDKKTKNKLRFHYPKPVEVPDPEHPFSVNSDFPRFIKFLFRREFSRLVTILQTINLGHANTPVF